MRGLFYCFLCTEIGQVSQENLVYYPKESINPCVVPIVNLASICPLTILRNLGYPYNCCIREFAFAYIDWLNLMFIAKRIVSDISYSHNVYRYFHINS